MVFVFDNQKVFQHFLSKWLGSLVDGPRFAAKTEQGRSDGGNSTGPDGVWMYQLTDKGIAAEITAKTPNTTKTVI